MRRYLLVLCLGSFAAVASAQVPAVRAGSFEVGGFVGASYGLDSYRVMGGGNVSYGVTKYLLPYVEYSYFPGIQREFTGTFSGTSNTYKASYSVPISDFHGGVHLRIPIKESRLVPYGVLGFGGLKFSDFNYTITYQDAGGTHVLPNNPAKGTTAFAVNYGAGLRYYISPTFGVRVEAKGYKPTGDKAQGFSDPFMKAEFGIFVQLR